MKRILFWSLLSVLAISIIITVLFNIKFGWWTLSNSKTEWGAYGDFISGTVGTFVNLANLVALVVITYYVKKLDDDTNAKNNEAQHHQGLNNFRYEAYKDLNQKVKGFNKLLESDSVSKKIFEGYAEYTSTFYEDNLYLFENPFIQANFENLKRRLNDISNILDVNGIENTSQLSKETYETVTKLTYRCIGNSEVLLDDVRHFIVNPNSKKFKI